MKVIQQKGDKEADLEVEWDAMLDSAEFSEEDKVRGAPQSYQIQQR